MPNAGPRARLAREKRAGGAAFVVTTARHRGRGADSESDGAAERLGGASSARAAAAA